MRKPTTGIFQLPTLVAIATLVALPFAFNPGGGSGLPLFFAFH